MRKLSKRQTVSMLRRGVPGYLMGYPTVVSLEMTHSCNADCHHCNLGGKAQGEKLIGPEDYTRLMRSLRPMIVQVSGGEPLLRNDLEQVLRAVKPAGKASPYVIVVSNGGLLNRERYLKLREAGMDQLSISLCFPDSRHDEWRRVKKLFAHLDKTIPELAALGYDDIVLNSAITRENMPYVMDLARVAERWGVSISFSAYSVLRTGEKAYTIESEEDLRLLRVQLDQLLEYKKAHCGRIMNADFNLEGTYQFFEQGEIKPCSAGVRFLVVTPDGFLKPCSMHEKNYTSISQIRREFVPVNDCGGCYVSIRSYLDKPLGELLREYFSTHSVRDKARAALSA